MTEGTTMTAEREAIVRKPFGYLEGLEAAPDAPISDNPSGLYCPWCRNAGFSHCSEVDYCEGMRPMRDHLKESTHE